MSYIKIEWSGYFDFPDGTYSSGSKHGEPYSGEFNQDLIRLSESGQIKYAIEEGEPTFPTYESFSFSLQNIDKDTGEQIFDFERLSVMGRTKEYGGTRDAIGDLFIRVTLPKLDNKVVFVGMMEDFSYTIRDFYVEVSCFSIIRFIKNSKYSMLKSFDLGSGTLEWVRNGSDGSKYALDQATNGSFREAVDINNNDIQVSYMAIAGFSSQEKEVSQIAIGKNIEDYFTQVVDGVKYYDLSDFNVFESKFFKRIGVNNFGEEKLTLSMFRKGLPTQFTCSKTFGYRNMFVKIGESTILTRAQPTINITFVVNKKRKIKEIRRASCGLNIVHMNNGFTSSTIDNKDVLVYERGRFQKKDGEQYKEGESISVSILDYDRGLEGDESIVSNGKFYKSIDGSLIDLSAGQVFYIGGIMLGLAYVPVKYINGRKVIFENSAMYKVEGDYPNWYTKEDNIPSIQYENKVRAIDYDTFNVVNHFARNFSRKFYSRFCLSIPDDNIIETKYLESEKHQHSFIADASIYDWIDKTIAESIVSLGRKLNAYIYINEESKIAFHSRNIHERYLPDNREIPGLVYIEESQYEIQDGKKYGYGSESYSIKWNDILEVNNIKSDLDITETVTREGITEDLFVTPKELELSNYRTSNLAVPAFLEDVNMEDLTFGEQLEYEHPRILRRSPFDKIPEEHFSMTPVQMAVNFARSYEYPSILYSINLDPFSFEEVELSPIIDEYDQEILDESARVFEDEYSFSVSTERISVGDYLAIRKTEEVYGVYMVKEIIYSGASLLEKATSVPMVLLFIKDFIGLSKNLRDESNILILDKNDEPLEAENYA